MRKCSGSENRSLDKQIRNESSQKRGKKMVYLIISNCYGKEPGLVYKAELKRGTKKNL